MILGQLHMILTIFNHAWENAAALCVASFFTGFLCWQQGPQMHDSGSLEMGKIEVYKWVDIGMNLGNGYMISTFQNHISKDAAVKGV